MLSFNLIAATGLLAASAVQAAPRAMSFDASEASTHAYAVDEKDAFSEIVPRGMEWARSAQEQVPTDCPAPVLIVTTTTVDVTVYVTPSSTAEDMTTPMATDTPRVTISIQNMTVPEPCDDDTTASQTSTKLQSSSASMTMSSSSSSTSAMSSSSASTSSTPSRVTISIIPEHTTTPAPSEMETPPPCDEGSTFSYFTSTTAAPAPTQSSSDCVIDTAVTPVSTSTMSATPTTASAQPTKTQCVHDEPTGKPTDQTMYCGIHGKPAGTYFIAEFIENKPEEPVTEEGCYQFCDSVMESTKGCESYRFYKNNLGAPRCSLYGRNVAASVEDLDKNQPDTWYDLACGSPTAEKWHNGMPANHGKRSTEARV
ncbi:hypothetical protein LEL_04933 [Akanthomyces lecanii RCEF 1005]|uniref:Apple domain-containing protein n=1 Tax=Akanthomyces lecanii RCEF 1005 TaxID=1081108 RepID=A0A168HQT1_CORDF|nr:hypothetical protein LEL_04933 [Akanthomyces lecanii RCEF 1005]